MKKRHHMDHGALARQTAAKIQNSYAAQKNMASGPPAPPPDRSAGPIMPQSEGTDEDSGGSQAF